MRLAEHKSEERRKSRDAGSNDDGPVLGSIPVGEHDWCIGEIKECKVLDLGCLDARGHSSDYTQAHNDYDTTFRLHVHLQAPNDGDGEEGENQIGKCGEGSLEYAIIKENIAVPAGYLYGWVDSVPEVGYWRALHEGEDCDKNVDEEQHYD